MSPAKKTTILLWCVIVLVIIVAALCGCTDLAAYEKTVDSRSIEGYAKDSNGNPQGGVKYTVHYR